MGDDRSDIGVIGYSSHNARIVQIRRFCMTPPRGSEAKFLRLVVAGEGGESLADFNREDCVKDAGRAIPEAISMALEEHAETVEQEVYAVLGWCREDGTTITTKRLRARPRGGVVARIPGMTIEESAQLVGNGDSQAVVSSVIRSNEIYLKSHLQSHHTLLMDQRELNQVSIEQAKMSGAQVMELFEKNMELMTLCGNFQREAIELRAENEQLKKQLAQYTDDEEAAEKTAVDEAQAEVIRSTMEAVGTAVKDVWPIVKVWGVEEIRARAAAKQAAREQAEAAE